MQLRLHLKTRRDKLTTQPRAAGGRTVIWMIATGKPLTQRFKLVLAALAIAMLAVGSTQVATAQLRHTKKHHKLKVRMINPFYEGIAVKPPAITYFVNSTALQSTVDNLQWQNWGGPKAEAIGQNDQGSEIQVALFSRRYCGLPHTLFYTRITVGPSTYRLQCKLRVISGEHVGTISEKVWGYSNPRKYTIAVTPKSAALLAGKWRHLGRVVAQGRGVVIPWYTFPDFRWAPALMVQRRPGYCPQLGAVAYLKVQLIAFGNGIEQGSIPFSKAASILRRQVGKVGPKHAVHYNYQKWCKRKRYPEEQWGAWE